MENAVKVRDLILTKEILTDPDLGTQDSLISSGLLDSLDLVRLIAVIEEAYGLSIQDSDMRMENFESCDAIAEMIARYTDPARPLSAE